MIRDLLAAAALITALSLPAGAEQPAMLVQADSYVRDGSGGRTSLSLVLSRGVPFRIFTLDDPARLAIDFRGLNAEGQVFAELAGQTEAFSAVRYGAFRPGWSRMVADLTGPLRPGETSMNIDENTGRATLSMQLAPVSAEAFAAKAGAPDSALWPKPRQSAANTPMSDDRFVVMIDPGHGGIDPGAERDGFSEKQLMLELARELSAALRASGMAEPVLTRDADIFVSLQRRVALAHQVGADVMLSLHADALSEGGARGATVYTLSETASDKATALLATRHNRSDALAGADLTGADDTVTGVLLDLARRETDPRSDTLADALIQGMRRAGSPMNSRPLREAGFSVLKSADVPSVLIEVGFLSSQRDLDNLQRPEWRAQIVGGIVDGLLSWRIADEARRDLLRQ
ncbi:N-acetylmuramoyl-L-alanine amidase [uncultured Roseobacter sp.]|uniref:N-acetylmuramoyl-L-alanine amidase n=1 Tax=uncultured Roseobacter sp. TaxID=114847 RepID=UPI002626DAE9|nr:N-acetylmuramoyl-L-alanine amidase [uncultured Roseobacter sp.]